MPDHFAAGWFLVCCLAAWRVTALLYYESGPFDLVIRFRALLVSVGGGRAVECFHCLGLWVSVAVVGLAYDVRPRSAAIAGAVAGAVSLIERALDGYSDHVDRGGDGS